MSDHAILFAAVRKHPSMYVANETFACVSAFLLGYDLACEGGVLVGFREWLAVHLRYGSNLSWIGLVEHASFPNDLHPEKVIASSPVTERHAIDTLFDLVAAYDKERNSTDGLRNIFLAYQRWLDS